MCQVMTHKAFKIEIQTTHLSFLDLISLKILLFGKRICDIIGA